MASSPDAPDEIETRVTALLDETIAEGVCSAASVAVGDQTGERMWWRGRTRSVPDAGPPIELDTPYDLASVTKPMATAAIAMALISEGRLALDDRASRWLPVHRDITVAHLLGHAAGYPAHLELFRRIWAGDLGGARDPRTALMTMAMATPIERPPGVAATYSDLGFITLGALLERAGGASLAELHAAFVAQPLGLRDTGFVDLLGERRSFATPPPATEHDSRRGLVAGEVHDENCHAGGGIAGHAGLFAPLADVATFARAMAGAPHHGAGRIDAAVAEACFSSSAAPDTSWRLGWDTPSREPGVSHAGDAWPREHAVGHLGFTGTSVWIDHARGRWVVLLTNRVHPSRSRPEAARIKDLRRAVGDLAWALLERGL
ncbi:MAG TPA: serine hydrolase domain-containing protein [Kofleriaceae bacterium]|nr:serine hydrolase domain-containing protein [Kofleriaceae bacterium]